MQEVMPADSTVGGAKDGEGQEFPFSYCSLPEVPEREFSADVGAERAALIMLLGKKWVNGTVLHYYFFDQDGDGENVFLSDGTREFRSFVGDDAHHDVVRRGFQTWKDLGIGLEFEEVSSRDEAEVRIGFMQGDGSWSYIGRDIIDLNPGVNKRTMNFGWDITRSPSEVDTAIHEIGHTLGFPHEHQNPNAGIVWDEEAVYAALSRPPNSWSREKTFYNIIRKISPDEVQGSSWDPDSIMHYPFGPGLIKEPEQYHNGLRPGGGLSERDKQWVRTFYPPLAPQYPELKPFDLERLEISPGEQKNFVIRPQATRTYTMQTFGVSDTVMVLFEDDGGDLRYVTGDDDSGLAYNANIRVKLYSGRRYVLRVRLYYVGGSGVTAVLMW
jgi:hypothetical protein